MVFHFLRSKLKVLSNYITKKSTTLTILHFTGINSPDFQVPQRVSQKLSSKIFSVTKSNCSKICSKDFLYDRLPCLSWVRSYDLEHLIGDMIAGVTTALTVIPQGIGYAPLAGLPLQYGLYASIVPGFLYCLLGTTRQITVGPTAVNSLMSFNYAGGTPYKAVTLAFFSGLIEMMAGVFNLGFLIQYISVPVISAFSTAVSIQVPYPIIFCIITYFIRRLSHHK